MSWHHSDAIPQRIWIPHWVIEPAEQAPLSVGASPKKEGRMRAIELYRAFPPSIRFAGVDRQGSSSYRYLGVIGYLTPARRTLNCLQSRQI